jgi:NTE family protein
MSEPSVTRPADERRASDDAGTAVAVACQGGGSHTAFTAGVLRGLFENWPDDHHLVALSGTSGGALCAALAWFGPLDDGPEAARSALAAFWAELAADDPVDSVSNASLVWGSRLQTGGAPFPSFSPYQVPFSRVGKRRIVDALDAHVDFDRVPELAAAHPLRLLVGTVDVNGGRFEVFSGASVTRDALLASTAVPDLFEAVEIHGHWHWDGLFSQNPPVHDLLAAPVEHKPDEIWVVQINPQERPGEPTSLLEIADRRNELSGNISLNQELNFIRRVNEWVDAGHLPDSYKPVAVERIELGRALHCSSKLDRSPSFLQGLIEDGETAAARFLDGR